MLSYNSLKGYYEGVMSLTTSRFEHSFSVADIENMYPFERDIYAILILNYLEEQKDAQSEQ